MQLAENSSKVVKTCMFLPSPYWFGSAPATADTCHLAYSTISRDWWELFTTQCPTIENNSVGLQLTAASSTVNMLMNNLTVQ